MPGPGFSLIVLTRDGMPGVQRTIAAIERQSWGDVEVIAAECGSTDGTLEYLHSLDQSRLHIGSAPDGNDACNQAMQRARGPLVVILGCDAWLADNALERFAVWHDEHPDAAFVYGGTRFWKSAGEVHSEQHAEPFDLFRLLMSEMSPTAGGYFNKAIIGADFYLRQDRKTSAEFDLFIRLGLRFGTPGMINKWEILLNATDDKLNRSPHSDIAIQMGRDRHAILERHFRQQGNSPFLERMRRTCISSMYCQLAGDLFSRSGDWAQVRRLLLMAHNYEPGSVKLAELVERLRQSGADFIPPERPPDQSPEQPNGSLIDIADAHSEPVWAAAGARIRHRGDRIEITTGWAFQSPAALIPFKFGRCDPATQDGLPSYRVEMRASVLSGRVGIGILAADGRLRDEQPLVESDNRPISLSFRGGDQAVLVRNLTEGISALEIADLRPVRADCGRRRDEG